MFAVVLIIAVILLISGIFSPTQQEESGSRTTEVRTPNPSRCHEKILRLAALQHNHCLNIGPPAGSVRDLQNYTRVYSDDPWPNQAFV